MYVIAEMLGVPRSDLADFKRWSDAMIEAGGGAARHRRLDDRDARYFAACLGERRRAPKDDLVSTLARADIDGAALSDPEILMFCVTLLAAGNETTRNLISGGSLLLMRHPDERRRLLAEPRLLPNAVEEMLRWWTPVQSFIRRATSDTELRGRRIREGEAVLLLYASANRDEEVWGEDSDRFDVGRDHSRCATCLRLRRAPLPGAPLARLEARVMFEELLARFRASSWPASRSCSRRA
jgi:cytochrome P450